MDIDIQEIKPQGVVISAIGVGGGGSNMINHLMSMNPHKSVRLIAANTDVQALEKINADIKIKLGERITGGRGAGAKPEVGERAALETYEEIKAALSGSNLVFIAAGLGGGTGTGAAPVVAKAAKEVGALTVGIVTKPFSIERRMSVAEEGLRKLRAQIDCIIVIPNSRLKSIIPKNCGWKRTLEIVDEVLSNAVIGISNVILEAGRFNVDFADVETIMSHKGLALMSIGEGSSENGNNAACEAVRRAIESPLLDTTSIKDTKGVLINFECNEDYSTLEMEEAMEIIDKLAADGTQVIWGMRYIEDMPIEIVRVTVIATGFEQEILDSIENKAVQSDGGVMTNKESRQVEQSRENLHLVRKASSGDYNLFEQDVMDSNIDVPAYLRKQKD